MILKTLQLKNYKQYQNLNLEFKEGLVGIVGKNGAGKSTLFDAIIYCIFGKDEDQKNLIRSTYSDTNSIVELLLDFELNNKIYTIKRFFKGKNLTPNAELYQNEIQICKGSSSVNEYMVKLLNLDKDAFKRSVFSGQKELGEISETTGESRKKMIRKMVGLEKLDIIQTTINKDTRSFKDQITGQTLNLLTVEQLQEKETNEKLLVGEKEKQNEIRKTFFEQFAQKEQELVVIKQDFEREDKKYNQYIDFSKKLETTIAVLNGMQNHLTNLNQKKNELEKLANYIKLQEPTIIEFEKEKIELIEIQKIYDKTLKRNFFSNKQISVNDELQRKNERITELKLEIKDFNDVKILFSNTQQKLNESNKNKITILDTKQGILNEISTLKGKISDRIVKIESIKKLGRISKCPTCQMPMLISYDKALNVLEKEVKEYDTLILNQYNKELENIQIQINQIEDSIKKRDNEKQQFTSKLAKYEQIDKTIKNELEQSNKLNEQITQYQKQIEEFGELKYDVKRFELLKSKVQTFEQTYIQYKSNENKVKLDLPKLFNEIEESKKSILNKQNIKEQTDVELKSLNFSKENYEKIKQQKIEKDAEYNVTKDQLYKKDLEIKEVEYKIKEIQKGINNHFEIIKQISDKQKEIEYLENLSSLIAEFKTNILERISPTISNESSQLFNRITKGRYEHIKVDDNFDFFILDNGVYFPISRFSGGEIDLANLCLRIAITKAITELSGSEMPLEFLAFDEVFGSQDDERRHEIMLALNYLQEQFRQIYIISHIETVKEYFPNILDVSFETEGSKVKWI